MITQEQVNKVKEVIKDYFTEAMVYDKGYLVLEADEVDRYAINFYYSLNGEVKASYGETREETIGRMIYVLDCEYIRRHIDNFKKNFYNNIDLLVLHILGGFAIIDLEEDLDVRNLISVFIPRE